MTETVYAVRGGFEDWAYAGGWDLADDAALSRCIPLTEPALDDDFFTRNDTTSVRSATYLIETHNSKHPSVSSYGGRYVKRSPDSSDFQVLRSSIDDQASGSYSNGNINRNIRAAIAMIDLSKPYIWVISA